MIIVAGHITVQPEQREAHLAASEGVVEGTRGAASRLDCAVTADPIYPGRFDTATCQTVLPVLQGRTVAMRKLISHVHSTINGVVTGAPGEDKTDFVVWTQDAAIEDGSEILIDMFDTVDTILLGRGTYEDLSRKWPFVKDWPDVGELGLRLGEKVNNAPKLVATGGRAPDELRWGEFAAPERLTGSNIEEQLEDLKNGEGGDIIIFGSPKLVRSLTDANLIDEYHMLVHPVVVNQGEHLFDDLEERKDFRLIDTETFEHGAILVKYGSARA